MIPLFGKKRKAVGELDMSRIPAHIGVIMDGNGRWARRRGLPRSIGHKRGADNLEHICDYCNALGVKALTAYAFPPRTGAAPKKRWTLLWSCFMTTL